MDEENGIFSQSIENPKIISPRLVKFQEGESNETDFVKSKYKTTKASKIEQIESTEDNINIMDMTNQQNYEDGMLKSSKPNDNVKTGISNNDADEVPRFSVFKTGSNASLKQKYENDKTEMKNESNVTQINTKSHLIDGSKKNAAYSLEIPPNIISDVLSCSSSSDSSNKGHYASCGLWDFAGQRDFYATHQAFLTSSAIYILVTDMDVDIEKQGIHQHFADFENVGGMLIKSRYSTHFVSNGNILYL